MKVLIVEDKVSLASLLKADLESAGYSVDTANDGFEGEQKLQAEQYDLMVVDWSLPKQDARTLIENMHASKVDTRVLVLTAIQAQNEGDNLLGMECCADDTLLQPYLPQELISRVVKLTHDLTLA